MKTLPAAIAMTLSLWVSAAGATTLPAGHEFKVSNYTAFHTHNPTAATDSTGRTLVVWEDERRGILGRFFGPDEKPLANEFGLLQNVNLPTIPGKGLVLSYQEPAVAFKSDGSFTLFYTQEFAHLNVDIFYENRIVKDRDVYSQAFSADGHRVGDRVRVNVASKGFQGKPQVLRVGCLVPGSACADGNLLVVWEGTDLIAAPSPGDGIFGRIYDAAGNPLGGPFKIASAATGVLPARAALAASPAGGFVIAWDSEDPLGGHDVYALAFDPQGHSIGRPQRINRAQQGFQIRPAAAFAPNGQYLIVWQGPAEAAKHYRVFGQIFSAGGARIGDEFAISSGEWKWELAPSVAASGDAGYFVAWIDWDGTFPISIKAAEVSAAGILGEEIRLDDFQPNAQFRTTLVRSGSGDLLALWEGFYKNDQLAIEGRWLKTK